jgi:hypothetical protein
LALSSHSVVKDLKTNPEIHHACGIVGIFVAIHSCSASARFC